MHSDCIEHKDISMVLAHSHHKYNLHLYESQLHWRIQYTLEHSDWMGHISRAWEHSHHKGNLQVYDSHYMGEYTSHWSIYTERDISLWHGSIHTINITSISMSYNVWAIHRTLEHSEWVGHRAISMEWEHSYQRVNLNLYESHCIEACTLPFICLVNDTAWEDVHCTVACIQHGCMQIARICNGQCDSLAVKYYSRKYGSIIAFYLRSLLL